MPKCRNCGSWHDADAFVPLRQGRNRSGTTQKCLDCRTAIAQLRKLRLYSQFGCQSDQDRPLTIQPWREPWQERWFALTGKRPA